MVTTPCGLCTIAEQIWQWLYVILEALVALCHTSLSNICFGELASVCFLYYKPEEIIPDDGVFGPANNKVRHIKWELWHQEIIV